MQTTLEEALRDVRPQGFQSTFRDTEKLRELNNTTVANLDGTVDEYNGTTLTERDVIETRVQRILTSYLLPERTIELPGLAFTIENNLLAKFATRYKQDNDTPSGTIKNPARAGTDDIVFDFIFPEFYNEVNDNGGNVANFKQFGLAEGTRLNLVGEGGIDIGANTDDGTLQLDDDEYVFFTGDFIDFSSGRPVVSKQEWRDVDGEEQGVVSLLFDSRLGSDNLILGEGTYATSTLDLDFKVYEDGDAELVPVAFILADGQKAPNLV